MKENNTIYVKTLKTILWIYIILCFVIAGLNYGYANKAPQNIAKIITWIWLIYENWIKTLFILICSFLTLKIIGSSKRTKMRKRNLFGFIIAALIVHVVTPLIVHNYELYFYSMPLPWSTTALQLLERNSSFYHNTIAAWGPSGIISAFTFFICINVIVFIGTLLYGRRFQCSTICLFNGFAAEVFEPAIPLIGKRKKIKPGTIQTLNVLRWVFLAAGLFFICYWILHLIGLITTDNIDIIAKIETYKYLVGELLMMMFFWIAFRGRGYCYFCPLGTALSLLSFIADQKITTDNTTCIKCNKCNDVCPMSIDIKSKAIDGIRVKDIKCVGCAHCIDACPTQNLCYSTRFIDKIVKTRKTK